VAKNNLLYDTSVGPAERPNGYYAFQDQLRILVKSNPDLAKVLEPLLVDRNTESDELCPLIEVA